MLPAKQKNGDIVTHLPDGDVQKSQIWSLNLMLVIPYSARRERMERERQAREAVKERERQRMEELDRIREKVEILLHLLLYYIYILEFLPRKRTFVKKEHR